MTTEFSSADPDLALSRVDKAQLISEAGMRMSGASNAVTGVQAKVGMSQQIVENAVAGTNTSFVGVVTAPMRTPGSQALKW